MAPCLAALAKWREAAGSIATLRAEWESRHRALVDDSEAFCRTEEPAEKREDRARAGLDELALLELLAPGTNGREAERAAWFAAVARTAKVAESFAEALAVEGEELRARRLAGVRRLANDREVTDDELRAAGVIDPRSGEPLTLEVLDTPVGTETRAR
jgi:hypothetical protein